MGKKLTVEEIEDMPGSQIRLRCRKTHTVPIQRGAGGIGAVTYKEGDVLPRTRIWLKSGMWTRADEYDAWVANGGTGAYGGGFTHAEVNRK